jgi:hypothetical protein
MRTVNMRSMSRRELLKTTACGFFRCPSEPEAHAHAESPGRKDAAFRGKAKA